MEELFTTTICIYVALFALPIGFLLRRCCCRCAVLQVKYGGQWYEATVEERLPSGVLVRFEEDGRLAKVPNDEIASRVRGAGAGELIADAASKQTAQTD